MRDLEKNLRTPWHTRHYYGGTQNGIEIFDKDYNSIAFVDTTVSQCKDEEVSDLVAAAPDLAEALFNMCWMCNKFDLQPDLPCRECQTRCALREAGLVDEDEEEKMNFAKALEALKEGRTLTRDCDLWRGRNMGISIHTEMSIREYGCIDLYSMFQTSPDGDPEVDIMPWIPTVQDLFADDWEVMK